MGFRRHQRGTRHRTKQSGDSWGERWDGGGDGRKPESRSPCPLVHRLYHGFELGRRWVLSCRESLPRFLSDWPFLQTPVPMKTVPISVTAPIAFLTALVIVAG